MYDFVVLGDFLLNFLSIYVNYIGLQRCLGHMAWAPVGCEGRSQAGPMGRQLEVGAQRAPDLDFLSLTYFDMEAALRCSFIVH